MIMTSAISSENFFIKAYDKVTLSNNRKKILLKISKGIKEEYQKEGIVNLNFICTHNSRRSQLGQVWAFFAANYFDLNIHSFSMFRTRCRCICERNTFFLKMITTLQIIGK